MLLKTRVAAAVTGAVLLVTTSLLGTVYFTIHETEQRLGEEMLAGKGALWRKIIQTQLVEIEATTKTLTRDRATLKALKNLDTQVLQDNAITTFNLLSTSQVISRLQIAGKDGTILFSAPQAFSGTSGKNSVRHALSEGRLQRGIERDQDGVLVAVVATPPLLAGKDHRSRGVPAGVRPRPGGSA